jgi:hypothetical protein
MTPSWTFAVDLGLPCFRRNPVRRAILGSQKTKTRKCHSVRVSFCMQTCFSNCAVTSSMRPNPSKRPQPRYLFKGKIATFANFGMGVMRLEVKVCTLPRPSLAQSSLISKRRPPNSFQDGPPQKFVVNDAFSQRIACLKPCLRPNRGGSKRACGHLPCLWSRRSPTFPVPFA